MKKQMIIIAIILMIGCPLLAYGEWEQSICPTTRIDNDCYDCHKKPSFKLLPTHPNPKITKIIDGKGYYVLTGIDSEKMKKSFDYFIKEEVKHIIVEIQSCGGPGPEMRRIIGIFQKLQADNVIIETRVYGIAYSAGFAIFVAGTKNCRFVNPISMLMWHEGITASMFKIQTAASTEDEAKVMRHSEDVLNKWLASISKVTKEELDEKIRKRDFWMSGEEALEFGFADGLLNQK